MTTYADVQQRIALDCLNRTDQVSEIQVAIKATIRQMENQRFWFNETSTALVAIPSVETIAVPANFLFIQELQVTQDSANIRLVPNAFDMIRWLNINNTVGLPTRYCQYGPKFHLANIPDSAYPIPCYYIKTLTVLSAETDTNDWLSAAEDVVVYGAASMVAAQLGNVSAAAKFSQLKVMFYNERLLRLRDAQASHMIRATRF